MPGANSLSAQIGHIVENVPGRMGVSVRLIGKGSVLEVNSSSAYPLASVYKMPMMAVLFHKAAKGEINLNHRLTLHEDDKSIGSDLIFFDAGTRLTLRELCLMMVVHSDNTATDMIHRYLGIDAPNKYMRELGLDSIDIYCQCREGFLLTMDKSKRFKGKSRGEIARQWARISRDERIRILDEVREETRDLSPRQFVEETIELWGISSEKETKGDREAGQAIDNYGSPSDIARLLELVATKKIAPERLTRQMIEFMVNCDVKDRMALRIPGGVLVANKSGGMPGTVNDSGIIFASKKKQVCVACLANDVKYKDRKAVSEAIGEVGLAVYKAFKD